MGEADPQRSEGGRDVSGQSTLLWAVTAEIPPQDVLSASAHADVCIVGAGIAGMTTAYLLARRGKSVIVLDDGPIAGGQTRRTTAHLANAIDDRYVEIERLHGQEGARLAAASHTAAIDRIEAIVAEERIDCDFERLDGFLFAPPGESAEILDREHDAAHCAGLTAVERVARAPLDGFETGPCLRFPRQGQFHPLKYLIGLARAILRDGGRIFTGTRVVTIAGGSPARIASKAGPVVTADAVVVATNSPVNNRVAIHTKQAPYLSYVIAARVPRGSVSKALYWDTADPYHYVRLQADSSNQAEDLLIVGGEDHKTGQADDADERYARLEAWARERFPTIWDVAFRWSGQVLETIDGLAFIGRNPRDAPNVFIASGDSGMGMTHGTIAGLLLTDLILGRANPWAALYDPAQAAGRRRRVPPREPQRRVPVCRLAHGRRRALGRGDRAGRRRGDPARTEEDGRLSRRAGYPPRALGGLSPPGVYRRLEPLRADVGLPVSRLALRSVWSGHQRTRERGPGPGIRTGRFRGRSNDLFSLPSRDEQRLAQEAGYAQWEISLI